RRTAKVRKDFSAALCSFAALCGTTFLRGSLHLCGALRYSFSSRPFASLRCSAVQQHCDTELHEVTLWDAKVFSAVLLPYNHHIHYKSLQIIHHSSNSIF